jgi:hypothetical protein
MNDPRTILPFEMLLVSWAGLVLLAILLGGETVDAR